MRYMWTKELATGYRIVDFQHKQLIQAVNNLLDACADGHGYEHIDDMFKFLLDYTEQHFNDEEALQYKFKYPDYRNHKKLHVYFKGTVCKVREELKTEGPTLAMVGRINSVIGSWLISHFTIEDKKVVAHINACS